MIHQQQKRRGRRKARCLQSLKHIACLTSKIKTCIHDTPSYLCSHLSKKLNVQMFSSNVTDFVMAQKNNCTSLELLSFLWDEWWVALFTAISLLPCFISYIYLRLEKNQHVLTSLKP